MIKKCKHCGVNLLPLGSIYYHPDSICEAGYGQIFEVEVHILDEELHKQFVLEHEQPQPNQFDLMIKRLEELELINNLYTEAQKHLNTSSFIHIIKSWIGTKLKRTKK